MTDGDGAARVAPGTDRSVTKTGTTSKIGVGNSPGGKPTKATVPRRRAMPMAWLKALVDTAVTSTPWAPPISR